VTHSFHCYVLCDPDPLLQAVTLGPRKTAVQQVEASFSSPKAQAKSGDHAAFYSGGTQAFVPWIRRLGLKLSMQFHHDPGLRTNGIIPIRPNSVSRHVFSFTCCIVILTGKGFVPGGGGGTILIVNRWSL
jgi:hypothetical protein